MREPKEVILYLQRVYFTDVCNQQALAILAAFSEEIEAPLRARIKELEAEVSTPVLVATNRLANALADARAEIERLREALEREAKSHETLASELEAYPGQFIQSYFHSFAAKCIRAALAPSAPEEAKP